MSKSKKKRTKKYNGIDTKQTNNLVRVHKVNAVVRSPFKQWLHEHRKMVKNIIIAVLVVAGIVFLIVQAAIAVTV